MKSQISDCIAKCYPKLQNLCNKSKVVSNSFTEEDILSLAVMRTYEKFKKCTDIIPEEVEAYFIKTFLSEKKYFRYKGHKLATVELVLSYDISKLNLIDENV